MNRIFYVDLSTQVFNCHFPFIFSKKTIEPSNAKILQNNIDLALVSHDQHGDNLDDTGKELLKHVSCILSTRGAEKRLKKLKITGLKQI